MRLQLAGAAKRLIFSLLLAGGVGGCAVYGPPYGAYGSGYAPAYGYSTYPAYSYSGGYPYAGPAYAYPPLSLGLGFTYFDRGPRYHGRHGWGHGRGHGWRHDGRGRGDWRGPHRGHGDHRHQGRGRGRR